ncbi:ankyrin repeat domain-containing protein [Mycena rebaudengoi]|nr:ankyrin repeat domain-containing protein [Mycena rebaudengoi]
MQIVHTPQCTPLPTQATSRSSAFSSKTGADMEANEGSHGTSLHEACSNGHMPIIQFLLENGADVHATSSFYGTPLQAAAITRNINIFRLLIENGAGVNARAAGSLKFATPLQAVSYWGNTEIVRLLLQNGADVNARGGEYGTALQAASCFGNLSGNIGARCTGHARMATQISYESSSQRVPMSMPKAENTVIRWWLRARATTKRPRGPSLQTVADINAGRSGHALHSALNSTWGSLEIAQLLLEHRSQVEGASDKPGSSLELEAASDLDLVRSLLANGADVNAESGYNGYGTPLRAASHRGHTEVARLLVETGADVNADGGREGSALYDASQQGHAEIVRLLLENGADSNVQGGFFGNALQAASWHGNTEIFGSALQAASVYERIEIIRLLLENGADINLQGGAYGCALQAAATSGNSDLVSFLISKGADVNANGGRHRNALGAASNRNHTAIVELLLQSGAEMNEEGQVPTSDPRKADWDI